MSRKERDWQRLQNSKATEAMKPPSPV